MKKKILLMLFAACGITTVQAQFSGKGAGTEKDPYQITNADQLFEVRNDLSGHYKVMNDIDLGAWIQDDNPIQGWSPIGNKSYPFTGFFDGNSKTLKGLYINKPNMEYVGLFGYTNGASIINVCLLNPIVVGKNYVGAVVGGFLLNNSNSNFSGQVVVGGRVTGEESIGGIIGGTLITEEYKDLTYVIQHNLSIANVSGINNVGGLCGELGESAYTGYYSIYRNACCVNNASLGNVEGTTNVGGIVGGIISRYGYGSHGNANIIESNLFGGTIRGKSATHGLFGNTAEVQSISKNICVADTISSEETVYRFCSLSGNNNIAFTGTVVQNNGRVITVEDDLFNGNSIGMKTLMRKNTYVGLGFDFNNVWNIAEGETLPFIKQQSTPGKVVEFVAGSRGKISGTAIGSGNVFVFIGDKMYESFVVDGQWEVTLGNTPAGTKAKVSVATNGQMPSIFVTAIAEGSSINPTKNAGDANGDGVVDSADVTAIINYILGKPSASFNKANADINVDDEILIDDAVNTVQIIMNAQ